MITPGWILVALLPCLASQARSDDNLLENGSFDHDIEGWSAVHDGRQRSPSTGAAWSSLDAHGSSGSGSIELRTSAVSDRDTFAVARCVVIPASTELVRFGGRIRVPSNQLAAGEAFISLEFSTSADCSVSPGSQSGLGGISNFDGWSAREETWTVIPRGSKAARFILSVRKKYVWEEGEQTGNIDDGEEFVAYFDDLFLTRAFEPKGPEKPPAGTADFWKGFNPRGSSKAARYGHDVVEAPHVRLHLIGDDGHELSGAGLLHLRSDKEINLHVEVAAPKDEDGITDKYRLQDVTVAASNNRFNWGRRPTVEFTVYRVGDPSRRPLEVVIPDGGGLIGLKFFAGASDKLHAIRIQFDCLRRALSASKVKGVPLPPLTDEQLLASPFASMVVANPVGEFVIVARYEALEAGFWHDPVFSEPLTIGIVEAPPPCAGEPSASQ